MDIDVERARDLTPGCTTVAHLNNAGASLAPRPVLDAVIGHLRREAEIGGYEAADEAADRTEAVYASVARLVGASDPTEIALVESATVAWDAAFHSLSFGPGDRILTGRAEYVSNAIAMLHVQRRTGVAIEVVDDDEDGQLSVDDLRRRIDDDVKLIALTHVPTNGGLVNPAAEVGAVARDAGIPYLLDACQSAGQLPLDVTALGCDFLSATGRKFLRGPRGTGFLWVSSDIVDRLDPRTLELRSATWTSPTTYEVSPGARRFEAWERSHANVLGLGAAVDHALGWGIEAIAARNAVLADRLRSGLAAIPGVRVHDKGRERCAIVTFTVDGQACHAVRAAAAEAGVNVSVASVTSAQFDMPDRGLTDLVRASVHYYNTDAEIDRLLGVVSALT